MPMYVDVLPPQPCKIPLRPWVMSFEQKRLNGWLAAAWFGILRPGHSGFTGGEIPNLWHDISVKRCQNEPDWLGWHFCYSQWDFPALMGLTLLSIWSFMIRHLPKVLCKPHYDSSQLQMRICNWGSNPVALWCTIALQKRTRVKHNS